MRILIAAAFLVVCVVYAASALNLRSRTQQTLISTGGIASVGSSFIVSSYTMSGAGSITLYTDGAVCLKGADGSVKFTANDHTTTITKQVNGVITITYIDKTECVISSDDVSSNPCFTNNTAITTHICNCSSNTSITPNTSKNSTSSHTDNWNTPSSTPNNSKSSYSNPNSTQNWTDPTQNWTDPTQSWTNPAQNWTNPAQNWTNPTQNWTNPSSPINNSKASNDTMGSPKPNTNVSSSDNEIEEKNCSMNYDEDDKCSKCHECKRCEKNDECQCKDGDIETSCDEDPNECSYGEVSKNHKHKSKIIYDKKYVRKEDGGEEVEIFTRKEIYNTNECENIERSKECSEECIEDHDSTQYSSS